LTKLTTLPLSREESFSLFVLKREREKAAETDEAVLEIKKKKTRNSEQNENTDFNTEEVFHTHVVAHSEVVGVHGIKFANTGTRTWT